MVHPNEENASTQGPLTGDKRRKSTSKKQYTGCSKYLHRFDELIMKPIFIYNYERNMQKKSKEFFNLFMKQGQNIEDEYTHHNVKNELRE